MSIRFFCSSCGQGYSVAETWIGRAATCQRCGGVTLVPPPRPTVRPAVVAPAVVATPPVSAVPETAMQPVPGIPNKVAMWPPSGVAGSRSAPAAAPQELGLADEDETIRLAPPGAFVTKPASERTPQRQQAPASDDYELRLIDDEKPAPSLVTRPAAVPGNLPMGLPVCQTPPLEPPKAGANPPTGRASGPAAGVPGGAPPRAPRKPG